MKINIREAAFNALNEIEENKQSSDVIMQKYHDKLHDARDRALLVEIVHGVLKNRNLLDYYINYVAKKGIKDKNVINLLRVSVYEIIFLDKIPEYATIYEAGEIVKRINRYLLSFVNAILRNIVRKQDEISKSIELIKDVDLKSYLSIKLSYPIFLIEYLENAYGIEKTIRILEFLNLRPSLSVKVNTRKTTLDDFVNILKDEGYQFEQSCLNDQVIYLSKSNIKDSKFYKEGFVYFQDAASSMPVKMNKEDIVVASTILDLCASPGGKSFNAAELTNGKVISCDIRKSKMDILKENIKRLGFENIDVKENDALILNRDFLNKFDVVIADLPCSGFGTIRKKPEIKWNKSEKDIEALHQKQLKILENAAKYIKKNGIIIYSTCTLGKRENEDTVEEFLRENKNFRLCYQKILFPDEFNCDGFYIAKIKREE